MIRGFAVRHGHKTLDPAGFGVLDRKELLMFPHRGLQHLGRQMQEVFRNRPHQRDREFDQPRDLGQQALVFDQLQPLRKGQLRRIVPDHRLALGTVQHHLGRFQLGGVIGKAGDGKAIRRHEAMPGRGGARLDAVDVQIDHRSPGVIGQKAQDRMQRAHPFQRAIAPAHRLRPGEAADRLFQHLGDDFGRGAAGLFDHGKPDLALFVVALFQLFKREARGAQEALHRSLGRGDGRALAFLAERRAFGRQPIQHQHQTARGRKRLRMAIGQTGLDQTVGDHLAQGVAGEALHARRDFFREKFDQQFGHVSFSPQGHSVAARHRPGHRDRRRRRDRRRG